MRNVHVRRNRQGASLRALLIALLIPTVVVILARSARRPHAERTASDAVAAGQDWLLRHQAADGLWHAHTPCACSVPTVFEVDEALTGLALVAMEGNEAARTRGVAALLAAQKPDGSFGTPGTPKRRFNMILPAWALVRIAPHESATRRAVHRVELECRTRALDDCEAGWALLLFQEASARGIEFDPDAEAASREALEASVRARSHTTPVVPAMLARFGGHAEVPSVAASDDLHLLLFALPLHPLDVPEVERYLLATQETHGCAAGSWPPDRWWGTAGGRVYATATAMIVLREAASK